MSQIATMELTRVGGDFTVDFLGIKGAGGTVPEALRSLAGEIEQWALREADKAISHRVREGVWPLGPFQESSERWVRSQGR